MSDDRATQPSSIPGEPDDNTEQNNNEDRRPAQRSSHNNMPSIPNWLFYTVVLLVLGLWGVGLILSFISPNSFQMPASLNGAVPVVLVGLFGTKAASDNRRGGNDNDE